MLEYPGSYIVRWCRNLPPEHGLSLAHLYLIVTAKDMTPMFLEGEDIWRGFAAALTREDVPVRMAARVVSAAATLGFLLDCLEKGQDGPAAGFPVILGGNPARPVGAQAWALIAESCRELRQRLCGPEHAARWLEETLRGPA